jgi:hypothetical protein
LIRYWLSLLYEVVDIYSVDILLPVNGGSSDSGDGATPVTVFEWICIKYGERRRDRGRDEGEYKYRIKSNMSADNTKM